jgi:apolipoprotein N-acyltransferase
LIVMPPPIYDVFALLGGLLFPLAFAPFDRPWLAPLALALLFLSWLNAGPGRACARGYLFGLGQFGVGVSWVYISMHDYGGASMAEAGGLTALFVAFLALYPALAGWLAARWFGGVGRSLALLAVYPSLWVLIEWLRGWFLTGFPWLEAGASQTDSPLGQGLAPLLGVYGASWSVALLAGLGLAVWDRRHGRRRAAMVAFAGMLVACAWLSRLAWTQAAGAPFEVALLQGNVPQNQKWQPDFQRATLEMYTRMTREHWDARLIVWPETAVPAFYHQVKDTWFAGLQAEAASHDAALLIGIPVVDLATERYYNAIVRLGEEAPRPGGFAPLAALSPQGEGESRADPLQTPRSNVIAAGGGIGSLPPGSVYFKRHLVPFGEFLPLRPLLGFILDILQIPLADFARGSDDQPPLRAAGHAVAASICYEDIFGRESKHGLPEAAFLVNLTNDAWFGDSIAPHQHAQMARMRALETGRYLLRATNTGVTAIVSPQGKILAQGPMFRRAAVTGEIVPMSGATPYVRFGDAPAILGALLPLALAWRMKRPLRENEHGA